MPDFFAAFNYVIKNEDSVPSGKVTVDEGGRTRFGIAEKFHPDLPGWFWVCPAPLGLEIAQYLYMQEYWIPSLVSGIHDQRICTKLFDMIINLGVKQATILAQSATHSNDVKLDGKLGPYTVKAINDAPADQYLASIVGMLREYYEGWAKDWGRPLTPEEAKRRESELPGLLRRAEKLPS